MAFEDLALDEADGGVRVGVRLSPGARREGVLGVHASALKVAVRAAPERGRANDALIELLARALGVPRGAVHLVAGHTTRRKTVFVRGLGAAAVRARLVQLGAPP